MFLVLSLAKIRPRSARQSRGGETKTLEGLGKAKAWSSLLESKGGSGIWVSNTRLKGVYIAFGKRVVLNKLGATLQKVGEEIRMFS